MTKPDKHLKREQLLAKGVSLLMAQGYHRTGLKEILDAVQIPKGSFYHYFESKEAVSIQTPSKIWIEFLCRLGCQTAGNPTYTCFYKIAPLFRSGV